MNDSAPNFEDFIQIILESLQASGIQYLVGGAIAACYQRFQGRSLPAPSRG